MPLMVVTYQAFSSGYSSSNSYNKETTIVGKDWFIFFKINAGFIKYQQNDKIVFHESPFILSLFCKKLIFIFYFLTAGSLCFFLLQPYYFSLFSIISLSSFSHSLFPFHYSFHFFVLFQYFGITLLFCSASTFNFIWSS